METYSGSTFKPYSTSTPGVANTMPYDKPSTGVATSQPAGNYSIKAKYNADGSIGWDYFFNGQPITYQQYQAAGMNLYGDQVKAQGDLPTGSTAGVTDFGGDGGGGTPAPEPISGWWMGVKYNLSNPTEAEAYAQARKDYIENQYGEGAKSAAKNQLQGLQGLGQAKENKDAGVMQYFSNIAPNMYQSAEGETNKATQSAYDEGKVGIQDWLTNYLTQTAASKQQELDQIYQAIDEAGAGGAAQRIAGQATPGALDLSSYFNRLNSTIGGMPAQKASGINAQANTGITNILAKLNSGVALTPEEQQMALQYGIV